MTYTPVSHTLQGIVPTGGAVGYDYSPIPPTTNTAFVVPTFTFSQNPTGPYGVTNFQISDLVNGSVVAGAVQGFPTGRPSFGQLYPR